LKLKLRTVPEKTAKNFGGGGLLYFAAPGTEMKSNRQHPPNFRLQTCKLLTASPTHEPLPS